MIQKSQCWTCKHFLYFGKDGKPLSCRAFPDGVPDEIYDNIVDHTESYFDDNGFQWEERTEWPWEEGDGMEGSGDDDK